jgi:collagen type VII alpha
MDKFIKGAGRDPFLKDSNDYNPGFFGHLNALVEAITVLENTGGGGPGGNPLSVYYNNSQETITTARLTFTGAGVTVTGSGTTAQIDIAANSGPQGPAGQTGPEGRRGPNGIDGNQGTQGPAGVQGPQGPAGPQGPQGEIGPTGLTGNNGVNGNKYKTNSTTSRTIVSTGTYTFTVADSDLAYTAGQNVVIANSATKLMTATVDSYVGNVLSVTINGSLGSGSAASWDINLQGIQGPTGIQGVQGVAGPAGEQGIQGIEGPQGLQGVDGPTGLEGPTGPAGEDGIAGVKGNNGAIWWNVTTNPNGTGLPVGSVIGDFALLNLPGNVANGQTFQKTAATTWTQTANILGPAGSQGVPGVAGTAKTVVSFVVDGYGGPIVAASPGVTVFVLKIPFIGTYTGLTITADQAPGAVGQSITLDVTGFAGGGPVSLAITGASTTATSTPATTVTAATTLTFKVTNTATSNVTRLFVNLTGERS